MIFLGILCLAGPGWGRLPLTRGLHSVIPSVHFPAGLINEGSACAQKPASQKSKKHSGASERAAT